MQAVRDQVLFLPPCPLLTVCVPGSRLSCAQARRRDILIWVRPLGTQVLSWYQRKHVSAEPARRVR